MPTVPSQTFNGKTIPSFIYSDNVSVLDIQEPYRPYTEYWTFSPTIKVAAFLRNSTNVPYTVLLASSVNFSADSTPPGAYLQKWNFTINGEKVYYKTLGIWLQADMPFTVNQFEIEDSGSAELLPEAEMAWLMVYGVGYSVTYDLSNCTGDSANPSIIPINATVTSLSFTPDSGYAFNSGSCWIDGDGYPSGRPVIFVFDPETGGLRIGPISSDITVHIHSYIDPYNNPDNPDLIDGETDIPNADTISVPSLPGIGAVSSGMIGLFNPTASQMQLLADYMWTDFGGTGSTTEDILKEIVQAIKRSISNPLDYVIGLNIIPSQGLSVGSSTSVRFGFVNSNVSMPRLTSQYFVVDCGSLSFDKLCGDTFLDYAPYSKFSLYLPYIGVKEMDANDFVGHTISILYHGDVVTGGVTAYVLKDGSVMYQYSGCCALTIPLNADSWGNTISGAIQIATTLVGGAALSSAGGGFAAKRAGVMSATGAASIASNPSLLSPQVTRSGAISGGAGCMASQKPFVIREAARFHTTEGFNTITGYPSYYYRPLSSMHGFTSVLDVHLHGIPGTHEELEEIESLLKEGVIL